MNGCIASTAMAGGSPEKASGREVVRSLGGPWIIGEGEGEMPGGGPARTILALGYDTGTKRFTGTWIGSMMALLSIYDGALDRAGRALTLDSEDPSMAGNGSMTKYQDIIEMDGDGHRVLRAQVLDKDGRWQPLMTVHSRRQGLGPSMARVTAYLVGNAGTDDVIRWEPHPGGGHSRRPGVLFAGAGRALHVRRCFATVAS